MTLPPMPRFTKTVIAADALMLVALAAVLIVFHRAPPAAAGIGPAGYAQIARTALTNAGAPYGYKVVCKGKYSNPHLATVRVVCTMTEK